MPYNTNCLTAYNKNMSLVIQYLSPWITGDTYNTSRKHFICATILKCCHRKGILVIRLVAMVTTPAYLLTQPLFIECLDPLKQTDTPGDPSSHLHTQAHTRTHEHNIKAVWHTDGGTLPAGLGFIFLACGNKSGLMGGGPRLLGICGARQRNTN